jgi:integrase
MATVQLDYLKIYTVRRGRKQWPVVYYRRAGVSKRLLGPDGKPVDPGDHAALLIAWQAAHEAYGAADIKAAAAGTARTVRPRSVADLIAHYRASPEWEQKKPGTKRDYEKGLKPLEDDWGHLPVAGIRRPHVGKIRDRYAWRIEPDPAKPSATMRVINARQANRVITTLSILLSYAVDPLGWREDNPALKPRRLRIDSDGYRPWTETEFLQFIDRSDAAWRFNALFAVLSAQRGQDQVGMLWADYDGQQLYVVQEKGRRQVKLWIEAHPVLKAALDQRRAAIADQSPTPLTILSRPDGKPWKVNAFQKAAGLAIRAAGLDGVVWHGLRASAVSWAADGGATEKMLQAFAGHKTAEMSRKYARGADQRRLAAGAVRAIVMPIADEGRKGKKVDGR